MFPWDFLPPESGAVLKTTFTCNFGEVKDSTLGGTRMGHFSYIAREDGR